MRGRTFMFDGPERQAPKGEALHGRAAAVSRDTARDTPAEAVLDLLSALRRAAARRPDRVALVFDETGESLTFAALDARVDRVAAALAGSGVGHGDRVAIMLPNRVEWPLAWLGLARLGAVMVPVNPAYRSADAGFVLRHAGVRAVVTMRALVPLLLDVRTDIGAAFGILCVDGDADGDAFDFTEIIEAHAADAPPTVTIDSHTLVNVQYTSGTTGEPKGCMLSHSWFMRFAWRVTTLHDGLDETDTILTSQPFHYVDPQWNLATALLSGAALVVLDRFHPSTFWRKVRDHRVTWFYCHGTRGARRRGVEGGGEPRGAERVLRRAARPVQGAALLEIPGRSAAHFVGTHPQGGIAGRA